MFKNVAFQIGLVVISSLFPTPAFCTYFNGTSYHSSQVNAFLKDFSESVSSATTINLSRSLKLKDSSAPVDCEFQKNVFKILSQSKLVESLDLSHNKMHLYHCLADLTKIPSSVKSLNLNDSSFKRTSEVIPLLKDIDQLNSLSLEMNDHSFLRKETVGQIDYDSPIHSSLKSPEKLSFLSLLDTKFNDFTFFNEDLKHFVNLNSLFIMIAGAKLQSFHDFASTLKEMKLETLRVDVDVQNSAELLKSLPPSLTTFSLHLVGLKDLRLEGTVPSVGSVPSVKSLELYLGLVNPQIYLKFFNFFPSTENLTLRINTKFPGFGGAFPWESLKNLKTLRLRNKVGVTELLKTVPLTLREILIDTTPDHKFVEELRNQLSKFNFTLESSREVPYVFKRSNDSFGDRNVRQEIPLENKKLDLSSASDSAPNAESSLPAVQPSFVSSLELPLDEADFYENLFGKGVWNDQSSTSSTDKDFINQWIQVTKNVSSLGNGYAMTISQRFMGEKSTAMPQMMLFAGASRDGELLNSEKFKVSFQTLSESPSSLQEPSVRCLDLNDHRLQGLYISEYSEFPSKEEDTTFVIAGRGSLARFPRNSERQRVVLILSPNLVFSSPLPAQISDFCSQSKNWNELATKQILADAKMGGFIKSGVDVFVITSMQYASERIEGDKLRLISPKRVAAFELMDYFHSAKHARFFSMIDDNIEFIKFSHKIPLRSDQQGLTWKEFFGYAKGFLQEKGFHFLGLKESTPKVPFPESDQIIYKEVRAFAPKKPANLTESPQNELWTQGFGQKIFFFDWGTIKESLAHRGEASLSGLLPPNAGLPQEDLFFQLAIGKGVVISRKSIQFQRNRKGGSQASKLHSMGGGLKAEDWYNVQPQSSHFPEVVETIQKLIQTGIEAKRMDLEKAQNSELDENFGLTTQAPRLKRRRTLIPESDGVALESQKKKKTSPSAEISLPDLKFDAPDSLSSFIAAIEESMEGGTFDDQALQDQPNEVSLKKLRPNQIEALRALKDSLQRQTNRYGFFNMATGTGKSILMHAISHAALKAFPGKNVYVISPHIHIRKQLANSFILAGKPVESKVIQIGTNAYTGDFAALNNYEYKNGKTIFISVAPSFKRFISARQDLNDMSVLMIDEAHMIRQDDVNWIQAAKRAGVLVLGLTATPTPTTKSIFENEIYQFSREQGVQTGILTPWKTHFIDNLHQNGSIDLEAMTDMIFDLRFNVSDLLGSSLQKRITDARGIVFMDSVEEAKNLARLLNKKYGEVFPEKRGEILAHSYTSAPDEDQSFEDQEALTFYSEPQSTAPRILVAHRMLREGFDSPITEWVFLATSRAEFDFTSAQQILGRALRKTEFNPGKVAQFFVTNSDLAKELPSYPAEESNREAEEDPETQWVVMEIKKGRSPYEIWREKANVREKAKALFKIHQWKMSAQNRNQNQDAIIEEWIQSSAPGKRNDLKKLYIQMFEAYDRYSF